MRSRESLFFNVSASCNKAKIIGGKKNNPYEHNACSSQSRDCCLANGLLALVGKAQSWQMRLTDFPIIKSPPTFKLCPRELAWESTPGEQPHYVLLG